MDERLPCFCIALDRKPANEQTLDHASTGQTPAEKARGKDFGVVEHEEIAAREQFRQIAEVTVGKAAGLAIEHQQARVAPGQRRLLCNQFWREVEIEVGNVQSVHYRTIGGAPLMGRERPPHDTC
jgi:hypothetical protein